MITRIVEKAPENDSLSGPIRASDILAQRLPSIPQKPPEDAVKDGKKPEINSKTPASSATAAKPTVGGTATPPKSPDAKDKKPVVPKPSTPVPQVN